MDGTKLIKHGFLYKSVVHALLANRYALPIYGLAMSSSKLEEEASAIVITSDDTGGSVSKILTVVC